MCIYIYIYIHLPQVERMHANIQHWKQKIQQNRADCEARRPEEREGEGGGERERGRERGRGGGGEREGGERTLNPRPQNLSPRERGSVYYA